MIGFKIDCNNRTIDTIVVNNYKDIMKEIGNKCNNFVCPHIFPNSDVIFADYYGFYKDNNNGIMHNEYELPIFGNIVIIGMNKIGNISNVSTDYNVLCENISFLTTQLARKLFKNNPYNVYSAFSKN
jgi:hypothetical protein